MDTVYESEESKYTSNTVNDSETVKTYSMDNKLYYPYLMLEAEVMQGYRIQVISNSLEKKRVTQVGVPDGYFNVYLTMQGVTLELGLVNTHNLKNILQNSLYRSLNKYLMVDKDTKVEGDMMFSYCTVPNL